VRFQWHNEGPKESRLNAWAVVLAAVLCVPQLSPAAEQRPEARYTLFVEVREPHESNRAVLQKMLKAEGYDSYAEGEREITMVLTAGQLGKLFQAKIRLRAMEKSATSGTSSRPTLEGARIPARFEKLIRRVYFDSQRS